MWKGGSLKQEDTREKGVRGYDMDPVVTCGISLNITVTATVELITGPLSFCLCLDRCITEVDTNSWEGLCFRPAEKLKLVGLVTQHQDVDMVNQTHCSTFFCTFLFGRQDYD